MTATTFSRRFRVGKFTITMHVDLVDGRAIDAHTEWKPYFPGGLNGQMFRQYRRRRDACLAALAEQLGGLILSIDAEGITGVRPDGSTEEYGP